MAPPELSRYTPIPNVLHPPFEIILRELGVDDEIPRFNSRVGLGGHVFHVDVPLWFKEGFDDVFRPATDSEGHFVVFDFDE